MFSIVSRNCLRYLHRHTAFRDRSARFCLFACLLVTASIAYIAAQLLGSGGNPTRLQNHPVTVITASK